MASNNESIASVVGYPSTHPETGEALTFNMDYYLSSHMPMIERSWGQHGLKSWTINTFPDPCPLSGKKPPYLVQTTCYFDTLENLKTAFEKGAAETVPDVKNFSNVFPDVWIGQKGSSGAL